MNEDCDVRALPAAERMRNLAVDNIGGQCSFAARGATGIQMQSTVFRIGLYVSEVENIFTWH